MTQIQFTDPSTLFGNAATGQQTRSAGARSNVASDGTQLPNAMYWLNIGFYIDVPSKDDPSVTEKRLVSLPMGLPLDTMQHAKTNTNSPDINNQRAAGNQLLEAILAKAAQLAPGSVTTIDNLVIEVRRVAEKTPPAEGADNPYVAAMPQL